LVNQARKHQRARETKQQARNEPVGGALFYFCADFLGNIVVHKHQGAEGAYGHMRDNNTKKNSDQKKKFRRALETGGAALAAVV